MAIVIFKILPIFDNGGVDEPVWEIFLIALIGSAVLEFTTSYVLEKMFHAVWWDYSNIPTNIQGRICLPASCLFGLAGVAIVKFCIPFFDSLPILDESIWVEIVAMILCLFLGMDLALTVESLSRITHQLDASQAEFNQRMEENFQNAKDAGETVVLTAMLKADEAKEKRESQKQEQEKLRNERIQAIMENLSGMDQYHVRSIRDYRPSKKKPDQEKLKSFFDEMQKKAEKRQVKKSER